MPRALTLTRTTVGRDERAAYLERQRVRRDRFRAVQCNYWVFEDRSTPGTFIEFMEAGDAARLSAALARVGVSRDAEPILTEVELT